MSVRITPTQAPTNPAGSTNEVTITVDDQGGGGSNFQANVVAKFDPAGPTPTNISAPGIIVSDVGGGDSEIQWNNVQVNQNGTNFGFDSTCDSSYNYTCEATDIRANVTVTQTLNMDCSGAAPGPVPSTAAEVCG